MGRQAPPGAILLEPLEATVGTALTSATHQGKQQAAKHIPVLFIAPCPQPRLAAGSSGHGPSADTRLLPAGSTRISPTAASRCPF